MVTISRRTRVRHTSGRGARLAVALMTSGAFVLSTGLVLLTQGGASAAAGGNIPVPICHATNSDTNPYTFQTVDASSTGNAGLLGKNGHLMHRNSPNEVWKSDGFFNGVGHRAGQAKPDLISDYTDSHHVHHVLDGTITRSVCDSSAPAIVVDGAITVTGPSCPAGAASFTTSGAHITFAPASGSTTPGAVVSSVGTTDPGYVFAGGGITKTFTTTVGAFDPAACPGGGGGGVVPTTVTPDVHFTDAKCGVPGSWVGDDPAEIDYTPSGPVAAGPFTVTAAAKPGANVVIAPGARTTFTFTYTAPSCGGGGGGGGPTAVTPDVHFTDAQCGAPGSWSGDDTAEIVYTPSGAVAAGPFTVTAAAKPGANVVIAPGARTTFTFTYTAPSCGGGGVGGPRTVTPAVHFIQASCGAAGSWSGDDPAQIVYTPSGAVAPGPFTVTAAAKPGANVVIAPGARTSFTFTYTAPSCGGGGVGGPQTVTPAVHFIQASCGAAGSWSGDDPAQIVYTPSGAVAAGPFTVTAAAKPGANVVIAPGATTSFTFTYTAPSCGGGTTAPPQVVSTRAPIFTDATCAKPDATALDLPGTTVATAAGAVATSVLDGVTYTATGTVEPGRTVVIQANQGAAQVLTSGSLTRWTHTFAKPTGCSTTSAPSDNGGQQGEHGQHVVHHGTEAQQAAQQPSAVVPAFVDSGLVSTVSGQDAAAQGWLGQLRERALLLVLAGGLLLAAGGSWLGSCVALGRRRRGALV